MARLLALAVTILAATSSAWAQTVVTAEWEANADPYTIGYRLFYGTSPGAYQWNIDAGNLTSVPVNLAPGSVYYFAVRAYNASNELGPVSNEATIDLSVPTSPPTAQITASLSGPSTAAITWQTTNAVSASINGAAVGLSGSTSVAVSGTTVFTLVATGAGGQTATASATVTVTLPTAPGPPTGLSSSVAGTRVTLSWQPPAAGAVPTQYLVDAGTTPGGSDIVSGYMVGNVLTVGGDLPRGRYFARVRAANAIGVSGPSNEVEFRIGRRLNTPEGFGVTWEGTVATLSWSASAATTAEDVPTGYLLEAGSAAGLSDVATINVGNVTSFRVEVPPGRFYVRVRAFNDLGDSDPTPDLEVVGPGAPRPPTSLSATGTGSTVDLRWSAPTSGPGVTGYVIEAGSAPGLSNLAVLPLGDVTQFVTTAPPGVYYVRVRAVNARGASDPSNEIVVRR